MGFHINLTKNKLRRLKIEIYHIINKTSSKDNVITGRDPNKPLLTLRTSEKRNRNSVEVDETIEELSSIDQERFEGFSSRPNTEDQQDVESEHGTILGSTVRSCISAYKKIKSGQSSLSLDHKRKICRCTCHEDVNASLRHPIYHNQHCLSFCGSSNVELIETVSKELVTHVNYIEPKTPQRRGFWIFKRKRPFSSIPKESKKVPDCDGESTITAADRIEIIAQSTSAVDANSKVENEKSSAIKDLEIPNIETSYAKRYARSGTSLINFSRSNSGYGSPSSKQNKATEPWRMIMNDISLHAALLSTGSKPILSRSSINLGADFTSSKHVPSQQSFSNNSSQSELISFETIPALEQQELDLLPNNENIIPNAFANDEDFFDENDFNKSTKLEFKQNDSSTHQILDSRPSTTNKSRYSAASEPLEKDRFKGAETDTSAVYGGVFQDYNYSDDSVEGWKDVETSRSKVIKREYLLKDETANVSNEVLPLNISHKGLNRIF